MLQKYVFAGLFFLFSVNVFADGFSHADGKIFVLDEAGDFQRFAATMSHSHEDGSFSITVNGNTYTADRTHVRERHGRKIVYLAFSGQDLKFTESSGTVVMKGTYVGANNVCVFYGDIFLHNRTGELTKQDFIMDVDAGGDQFQYVGGFGFRKLHDES